jgi:hypothetical protein
VASGGAFADAIGSRRGCHGTSRARFGQAIEAGLVSATSAAGGYPKPIAWILASFGGRERRYFTVGWGGPCELIESVAAMTACKGSERHVAVCRPAAARRARGE